MNRYLLDRDVMSQLDQEEANRHSNVKAWLASVPDKALYISAITVMEAWKGLSAERKRASNDAGGLRDNDRYALALCSLLSSFAERIVPVDEPVARLWGELLGRKDKNRLDACVAATAVVHGMIVATRNTVDFKRRGARVLDPFNRRPVVQEA